MWSKTMIGYGDEAEHFVLELTYNYGVRSYELGNDFNSITICSPDIFQRLVQQCAAVSSSSHQASCTSPDGYTFHVRDTAAPGCCPITEVALNVSSLSTSLAYWHGFLGLSIESQSAGDALLSCSEGGCKLRLVQLPEGSKMQHGTAFGRIAFSCPGAQLQQLEQDVLAAGYVVHTPYVSLDTPGKATVQVVILADPDGHEICFVGDEGFRELSQQDPAAEELLAHAIAADGSKEWYGRRAAAAAAGAQQ
jgi:catechol 2,3-dioxygenase-like lactoylglutathione lyase family enzyme